MIIGSKWNNIIVLIINILSAKLKLNANDSFSPGVLPEIKKLIFKTNI